MVDIECLPLQTTWASATVGIGRRTPGYTLVFESIHTSRVGYMGIDDVTFSNCALGSTSTQPCAPNQFQCTRGSCVDQSVVCDFSDDCGDGYDEMGCSKYVERCNFETDLCNWQQDILDNFDWSYQQGKTATAGTGPQLDHTYGNATGHYIYIETSRPSRLGDKARIKSPVFEPTSSGCQMRFFYHMHGIDVNTLNVYSESYEKGPMILLWTRNGSQPDQWIRAAVDLSSTSRFKVVIEGIVGKSFHGDIAIDDVSFTPSCRVAQFATLPAMLTTAGPCGAGKRQCDNGQCVKYNTFCDFKFDCTDHSDEKNCPSMCDFDINDMCKWTNENNNRYNWTIANNLSPTATTNPGPSVDHTKGQAAGKYLILEKPSAFSTTYARVDSPLFSLAGQNCNFSMSYQTSGRYSRFNVNLKQVDRQIKLWSAPYRRVTQPGWTTTQIQLPSCASDFQIVIEGSISSRLRGGYIAVDDLQFLNCGYPAPPSQCMLGQYTCASGNCVPQNLRCDLGKDCCDGSDENTQACQGYQRCDFEYGLCGWQQMTTDQFDWRRHRGPTSSSGTGPKADHSSGTKDGYYLYIESSRPRVLNDTARIRYYMPGTTGQCAMRFWYHMYGANIGSLNVYVTTLDAGTRLVNNITSAQGNQWFRHEVSLHGTTAFWVIIEGKIGVGYNGDIAIDDITFTPGCNIPTTGPTPITPGNGSVTPSVGPTNPCPNNGFQCTDGTCIDSTKLCNFNNDCSDGSDERSCPSWTCQFENFDCNWKETTVDGFDWKRGNGGSTMSIRNMAPNIDATFHNQNGYYMYINDNTGGHPAGLVAELKSPKFTVANADCLLTFSFFVFGTNPQLLSLILIDYSGTRTELWRDVASNPDWQTVKVGVGRRTQAFNLSFYKRVTAGHGYSAATAIDQITFSNCVMLPARQTCNSNNHFWCKNKVCIQNKFKCDLTDNCGDHSDEDPSICTGYTQYNFENGLMDLIQGQNGVDDEFDWTIYQGSSPSSFTGPKWDHTVGTSAGHYIYVESSGKKYNNRAWLETKPFFRTNGRQCSMRFYFFMYGRTANQLNIYIRTTSSGPTTRNVFSRSGDQGSYWNRADIKLNVSTSFQVIIEGRVGDDYHSDIAIDDLSFTPGCQFDPNPLPPPTSMTTVTTPTPGTAGPNGCTSSQLACLSGGQCYNPTQKCDFRSDCTDHSDEKGCRKFNFYICVNV